MPVSVRVAYPRRGYYGPPRRPRTTPTGPDRYYHGTVIDATQGVSVKGVHWKRYGIKPDYYMVGGVVMREKPNVKWFSPLVNGRPVDLGLKQGDKVFLSGKFKGQDTYGRSGGDMLGDVKILSEQEFKGATGYPGGAQESGGKAPTPEPESEPSPTPSPTPSPLPTPGPGPGSSPTPRQPEVQGLKQIMDKIDEVRNRRDELIRSIKDKLAGIIPEYVGMADSTWNNLSSASAAAHLDNISPMSISASMNRIQDAIQKVQAQENDEDARKIAMHAVPEMSLNKARPLSPSTFLSMAQALLDHADSMVALASENPEGIGQIDFGKVSVQIPGTNETMQLAPLFGKEDFDQGVDHIEQDFIGPLNAEIDKARRAEEGGWPEFDHNVPGMPKSSNAPMGKDAILNELQEMDRKYLYAVGQINDALEQVPEVHELPKIGNNLRALFSRLDLVAYEVPQSERSNFEKIKAAKMSEIRNRERSRTASWVLRNCKWS